jgi:hypothetical protein
MNFINLSDDIANAADTIETVFRKSILALTLIATFTVIFAQWFIAASIATYKFGESIGVWYRANREYRLAYARQSIPAEDTDLDELLMPLFVAAPNLTTLSAQELRPLCQSQGIQWRNARGQGKHLAKAEMIKALAC